MAYSHSSSLGSSSSCLDGVPFKIGPKFIPPPKIVLPPDLELPSISKALQDVYTFELEEGVLKWTEERERQREAELERIAERTRQAQASPFSQASDETEEDSTPVSSNHSNGQSLQNGGQFPYVSGREKNGTPLRPTPARPAPAIPPRSNYVAVTLPNPLLANVSNSILTPTPIIPVKPGTPQENKSNGVDLTLFEKEDDPFDVVERQTFNDMEELKTVLESSNQSALTGTRSDDNFLGDSNGITCPTLLNFDQQDASVSDNMYSNSVITSVSSSQQQGDGVSENLYSNCIGSSQNSFLSGATEESNYQNLPVNKSIPPTPSVRTQQKEPPAMDISKLPPVPARRGLVAKGNPLPAIGAQSLDCVDSFDGRHSSSPKTDPVSQSLNFETDAGNIYNNVPVVSVASQPQYDNVQSITGGLKKPPRQNRYSRHLEQEEPSYVNLQLEDKSGGVSQSRMNVMFRNAKSNPDLTCPSTEATETSRPVPAPRRSKSPPLRPSSQQSWNRYSPLPATPLVLPVVPPRRSDSVSPGSEGESDVCSPPEGTMYKRMSVEARKSIDNLVNMGFSKPRVTRAVDKLGNDQKEVVEYLCLVDQLTEKGFDPWQTESALLIFKNNQIKAAEYLELYKQFAELGFRGDKIKEALVESSNDREKALDILTAAS